MIFLVFFFGDFLFRITTLAALLQGLIIDSILRGGPADIRGESEREQLLVGDRLVGKLYVRVPDASLLIATLIMIILQYGCYILVAATDCDTYFMPNMFLIVSV